jgi:DNA-binding response OmpR family regulator
VLGIADPAVSRMPTAVTSGATVLEAKFSEAVSDSPLKVAPRPLEPTNIDARRWSGDDFRKQPHESGFQAERRGASMKVLVVEDDPEMLDLLAYGLGREGYHVIGAIDGEQGIRRWRSEEPEIIVLDITLPKVNGFDVIRHIRENSTTPIIMLSARREDGDIIRALRLGADDYMSKPFSQRQLRARMEAVLRRSNGQLAPQFSAELRVHDLVLDSQNYQVTVRGNPVQLTRVEFRIFYILAANLGRIVPYSRLFEFGWGYDVESAGRDSALLKAHLSHIRDKLWLRNGTPLIITNMRGVGYSLTARSQDHQVEDPLGGSTDACPSRATLDEVVEACA